MNGYTDFVPSSTTQSSKQVMRDILLYNKLGNPPCRGSKQLISLAQKVQIPILLWKVFWSSLLEECKTQILKIDQNSEFSFSGKQHNSTLISMTD